MECQLLEFRFQEELFSHAKDTEWMRQDAVIFQMLQPRIDKDGDQWMCIYGELPEPNCIVGFGDTPQAAVELFIKAYKGKSH